MTEVLAGVVGALVGALAVFVGEIWSQVLAGKAAARLIRAEAWSNGQACASASQGQNAYPLSDVAWRTHAVHVVPLL
jgi:hypothetical protein